MNKNLISPLCICGTLVSGKGLLASLLNGHPDIFSFSFWHDCLASSLCYLSAWRPHKPYHFDEKTEKLFNIRGLLTSPGNMNFLEGIARQGYVFFTVSADNIVKLPFNLDFYEFDKTLMNRLSTLEQLDVPSVFSTIYSVLGQYLIPGAPRPKWGVSMPQGDFFRFEVILRMYPQAKIVFIMRDIDEVLYANSKREIISRDISAEDALKELTSLRSEWLKRMIKAKDIAPRFAKEYPDRFMTINFSDLVCDTKNVMTCLSSWLGIKDLPCLHQGTWNGVEIDKRLTGRVLDKVDDSTTSLMSMVHLDIESIKEKIAQTDTQAEDAVNLQIDLFKKLGWDYAKAIERTNATLRLLGMVGPFHDDMCEMVSQHWLALAAIASDKVIRILEIGTFAGNTTAFLAAMFPHAQIVTCDLPDDSQQYISTYGRQNPERKRALEEQRKKNLAAENITFIQKKSFLLPQYVSGKFDIIWMDGGHTYPDVAFDLCNSWHLLADDGVLLCDDVFIPQSSSSLSQNYDIYHMFVPLIRDKIIDVHYIIKRLSNTPLVELKGKMIAVVKKLPQSTI